MLLSESARGGDGGAERHAARVERVAGELRLVVDGAVQSVAVGPEGLPRGYWPALVPERRPANALVLGVGGGTVVHLLRRRFGPLPIVGVDDDQTALDLARRHFSLDLPQLSIVAMDAAVFVDACRERFGLVVVDLYRGETLADVATRRAFMRRVRSLVRPGGTLVWNLHRDRRGRRLRRRVGLGLLLERRVLAGLNLVLHFQRRARVRRRRQRPPPITPPP